MENLPENTCRVCLSEKEIFVNIFDSVEEFSCKISDLLTTCGDLKCDDSDTYPKLICEDCLHELFISAKFREKCQQTQNILEQFISQLDNVIEECLPDEQQMKITENNMNESAPVNVENDDLFIENFDEEENNNEISLAIPSSPDHIDSQDDNIIDDINDEISIIEGYTDFSYNDESQTLEKAETISIPPTMFNVTNHLDNVTDKKCSNILELQKESKKLTYNTNRTQYKINYICDVCGACFTYSDNLRRHLNSHDAVIVIDNILDCEKCLHPFTKEENLITHMSTKHSLEIEIQSTHPKNIDVLIKNEQYQSTQSLIGDVIETAARKTNSLKRFVCTLCGRGFNVAAQMQVHMRTHTGERPYKCSKCDKTFAQNGGLKLHERRHDNIRPYVCSICAKGFHESSNLKVHMRIHTGEKIHKCTLCHKSYARVFLLQNHLRTHTGERPFSCEYCNKKFIQKGDLSIHIKAHLNVRPHKCKLCDRGFMKPSLLLQHMSTHKNKKTGNSRNVKNLYEIVEYESELDEDVIDGNDDEMTDSENLEIIDDGIQLNEHLNYIS